MNKLSLFIIGYFFSFFAAQSLHADGVKPFGYFRASSGINNKGGEHQCFDNRGPKDASGQLTQGGPAGWSREFRLGNECNIYGELGVTFDHGESHGIQWGSQYRVAVISPGGQAYEGPSEQWHLVEAFVSAKNLLFAGSKTWFGKRFYREADLQLDDWYYFGRMSGSGLGIESIKAGPGLLDAAILRKVATGTTSSAGEHGLTALDLRWRDIPLSSKSKLLAWGAYAMAPGGVSVATQYEPSNGWLAGAQLKFTNDSGFDAFSLVHARGLLQTMSLEGNPAALAVEQQNDASRSRAVWQSLHEFAPRWSYQAALAYEEWEAYDGTSLAQGQWASLGWGPIYYLSDHLQWTSVIGTNGVYSENEDVGWRKLTRFTTGLQWAPKRALTARPNLRLLYTKSWWNQANQSFVATKAPAYASELAGSSIVAQFELWF